MKGRLRIVRALAALVIGAAGGTVLSTGVAFAAACPAGSGVTVVVSSTITCDANGGGNAASNFGDGGHSLTRTRKFQGFVCKVDGVPSNDPCITASPANAYWGLFWSDGKSGKWIYSNLGVDSLKVPAGGWVAFKFQRTSSTSYPGVTPYTAPPKPKPKPAITSKPKPAASNPAAAPTASKAKRSRAKPTPSSASASANARGKAASPAPSASPSASASAADEARAEEIRRTSQEADSPSSTLWVGGLLALTLLMGMGATIWRRRARQG